MARNNKQNKNEQSNKQMVKRQRKNKKDYTLFQGNLERSIHQISFGPQNPGKVLVRAAVELYLGEGQYYFSFDNFNTWCAQARAVLTPFAFFRVNDARVSVKIAGGTASAHSVIFNVSNTHAADSSAVAILNDDYCAIASAALCPTLAPPKVYWTQGARKWYNAIVSSTTGPTLVDTTAGCVSVAASGAAAGTIIGWLVVEMEIEFHTLL